VRRPPSLTEFPRYPITGGVALLSTVATIAYWMHMRVEPLFETAMIRRGELWRLITSILVHGDVLHLVFNLYWLWVFGTLLEQVFGPIKTAGLILLFAVFSNALEFAFFTGGIGLSGVGYGFFGLLWVLSSRDPRFDDAVDQRTVQLFIVWFFICIATTLANVFPVANVAHGAGAVIGIVVGFAIARPDLRAAIVAGIGLLVILALGAATRWRPVLNLSSTAGQEEARLGYEALVAHRNQDAVRWLRDAVAYQPGESGYWLDLAIAYERANDKPAAVGAYRRAADRGSAEAQCQLGELYSKGAAGGPKDDAQALYWFRRAAAQNSAYALNCVAWAYATSASPAIRNPAAALEYARKAVGLTGAEPDPAILDTLAEALYVNGRYEEAVKTEEQAIALKPTDLHDYQIRLEKYRLAAKR
jgi:membrane associated rhomboid family serine protease/TPR repeat protein